MRKKVSTTQGLRSRPPPHSIESPITRLSEPGYLTITCFSNRLNFRINATKSRKNQQVKREKVTRELKSEERSIAKISSRNFALKGHTRLL